MLLSRLAFPFTEEQLAVGDAARDFATRSLLPGAADRDKSAAFPHEQLKAMASLGLFGMKVPAEDGGSGTDNVGYALAMEAIAESCASTAVILASSNLASKILSDHSSAAQKDRFLHRYCRGELGPASFALTEPSGGSDASAMRTTARLDGDHWVLDGEKCWITSGAHAGIHLVFARSDGEGKGGISAFVVDRGTPGLTVGKDEDKMGQRASGTVQLHFEECRIPVHNQIGKRGNGYAIALSALGAGRVGIAALSIGIAESALREGLDYVKGRKVFGRPLSEMQNTQMVLADCRMELDAAWLMMLRAAHLLDRGDRAGAESSMAKLYATEACGRIVDKVLQLHGGYGYSKEYPIERHYRDARVTRIYEGTNEIQRIVIAREILSNVS